ncbi:hypothetical protein AGMMS49574_13170 [Bacteroidia bacterium]|nr:hypothetical protein AGMMS49574_13170 [Bacteroidia bacterium]
MKKILIICDLFPPAFGPRMGYLCKYLLKEGWEPTVLTEDQIDTTFSFMTNICKVVAMPYYSRKSGFWARLQRAFFFFLDLCFSYKDRQMYKEACRILQKQPVDIILCSTYRDFPLKAAQKAAHRYNLPWVADLRDIIEQYAGNEFISRPIPFGLTSLVAPAFKRHSLCKRNRALKAASAVTTVSPWHVEILKHYNSNVHLIYNGYDPELFFPAPKVTPQFVITYTGRLHSTAMQDPSLLFEALALLTKEGFLTPEKCRVRWYTNAASQQIIMAEAQRMGVLEYMDIKEMAPAKEIPAVLNSSSILLLLTNQEVSGGPKGVMTTKVFEYMAVEKPIQCVRSDENLLATLLKETQSGLAATTVEEVTTFLRHHYAQWQNQGYTTITPIRSLTTTFSRAQQAHQFIDIFEGLKNQGPKLRPL